MNASTAGALKSAKSPAYILAYPAHNMAHSNKVCMQPFSDNKLHSSSVMPKRHDAVSCLSAGSQTACHRCLRRSYSLHQMIHLMLTADCHLHGLLLILQPAYCPHILQYAAHTDHHLHHPTLQRDPSHPHLMRFPTNHPHPASHPPGPYHQRKMLMMMHLHRTHQDQNRCLSPPHSFDACGDDCLLHHPRLLHLPPHHVADPEALHQQLHAFA